MRNALTPPPKSRLLEGFGSAELQEVFDAGEIQRVGPYQILFIAGDTAAHLFLLLSGHVKFYRTTRDGNKVQLARLVRGNAFGLGTLLSDRTPYIGTAETTSACEFLVWGRPRIRKLAHKYPRLAENALGVILEVRFACGSAGRPDETLCAAAPQSGSVASREGYGQDHTYGN